MIKRYTQLLAKYFLIMHKDKIVYSFHRQLCMCPPSIGPNMRFIALACPDASQIPKSNEFLSH